VANRDDGVMRMMEIEAWKQNYGCVVREAHRYRAALMVIAADLRRAFDPQPADRDLDSVHLVRLALALAEGTLARVRTEGENGGMSAAIAAVSWVLPYPVGGAVNSLYRPAGGGRRILSPPALAWRDKALLELHLQRPHVLPSWSGDGVSPRRPPGDRFALAIDLIPPDHRKRDVDGPVKLVQDTLASWAEIDDASILDLHVRRHDPEPPGRIAVTLWAIPAEESSWTSPLTYTFDRRLTR